MEQRSDAPKSSARLAVYAGTFDPITNGHRDIVERALKIFDEVIFAVAESPSKNPIFSAPERVHLAQKSLADLGPRITVESFGGLLVDFVRAKRGTTIVRGLRAVSDYEFESQMAMVNRELANEIETVFLMTSKRSSFISSNIVRQIAMVRGDISSMVPPAVQEALKQRFAA